MIPRSFLTNLLLSPLNLVAFPCANPLSSLPFIQVFPRPVDMSDKDHCSWDIRLTVHISLFFELVLESNPPDAESVDGLFVGKPTVVSVLSLIIGCENLPAWCSWSLCFPEVCEHWVSRTVPFLSGMNYVFFPCGGSLPRQSFANLFCTLPIRSPFREKWLFHQNIFTGENTSNFHHKEGM